MMMATAALAQQRNFDVPAGPAVKSIPEFARQAGIQIIAPADQLTGVVTPPVNGSRDARAALRALIAGTSLEIASDDGAVISLRVAQPGAASAGAAPARQTLSGGASSPAVVQELVVTGSRVITNGNNSPSPVTVVQTQDLLQVQPGTLSEALATLPVFSGSRGSATNPSTNGSQSGGNGNSNQLNLRNLGVVRTLVLMDGNRVPPTSFNNVVDVDIIPPMLVRRVDVVTGGVSAVYGSDAIAGVVNYVIDRGFNGVRFDADAGVSQRGDNQRYEAGIAGGTKISDGRGHIEGSYQHVEAKGVLARSDRSWINLWGVAGSGTTANPYILYNNVRQASFPFGGLITNGVLAGQTFGTNGVLRPFVAGTPTGTAALQIGGDGGYFNASLIAPERADQLFGRVDYDLSDNVHAYAQITGDIKTNESYADPIKLSGVTLQSTNAFLAPAYQAQLAAAKQATFRLSELMGDNTRVHAIAKSKQWVYTAGLEGKLADYNWGVNFVHGRSELNSLMPNNPNLERLGAALDAVVNPANGQIVCNVTLTNPTARTAAGCAPLNPFGPTAPSAAALSYVLQPTSYTATTVMDDISGHIAGSPFALPAGPVNVAVSAEWRKLGIIQHASSTASPQDLQECTGIRGNCSAGDPISLFTFTNNALQTQRVKEGAIEAVAPLLKDLPFVESLSVNGAARYTSYDTSGNYWTWKLGADWHVTDSLGFRATKSRDIRAPTLYEAFAPVNSSPVNPVDLLTGLSPTVPSTDSPNPTLTAEIGHTLTGGVVWNPLPRLSIALDAYKILVTNAIVNVSGSTPSFQTLCYASGGSSPLCQLQARPRGFTDTSAANAVTVWYTKWLNLAEIETYGADLEVNYATTVFDHPGSIRVLTAYQPHSYYRQPGVPTVDQGGAAYGPTGYNPGAVWRISAFARYEPIEHFTIDILERWRNAMKMSGDASQVWQNNHIDAFATTNVTLSYAMQTALGQTQIAFNVSNLFDAKSPGGAYPSGTRAGLRDGFVVGDDVVGRAFTVGIKLRR